MVSKALYENHKRTLFTVDQIVDDFLNLVSMENEQSTNEQLELGQKVKQFLEERHAQYEIEKAEKEKKGKRQRKEEEEFVETFFLPMDLLFEVLNDRFQSEECNAGIIIDDLFNLKYAQNSFELCLLICKLLSEQTVQLVVLTDERPKPLEDKGTKAHEMEIEDIKKLS